MDDTRLSVLDHLEEMRVRMLKCMACVLVLFPVFYYFSQPTIEWLLDSFCPQVEEIHFMQPMELFFTRMKVGAVMAVAGAYPYIALHIWHFIAPGLYKNERHHVSRFVFVSTGLFLTGAGSALFLVYPLVLRFAVGMATDKITPMLQLRHVVNLAAMLMLGFGVMFQLPIIVYLLAVTELVSLETMKKARPVVMVVIFAVSAILTPPDIISQCALGFPSLLLFEISLIMAKRALRLKRKKEDDEEAEDADEDAKKHPEEATDATTVESTPETETETASAPEADDTSPATDTDTMAQSTAAAVEAPADSTSEDESWEEWHDHVDDDFDDSPPLPTAQPGDLDPYSDGPVGSGCV